MTWRPTPAMLSAVKRALLLMQPHYPRSLLLASDTSEAAAAWLTSYCRAFLGRNVALDAIEEAALRWPAEKGRKETPGPMEFAEFAESVSEEMSPALRDIVRVTERPEPPIPRPPHADAVDALSRHAHDVLLKWSLVLECWAVAWEMAHSDAMREDVRLGRVPRDVWDQVIGDVANGRVARTAGPLRSAARGAAPGMAA